MDRVEPPCRNIRELLAREGQDVVVSRGTSYENRDNLAPALFAEIVRRYENARIGRQELNAEVLEDVPGALFAVRLDRCSTRRNHAGPDTHRGCNRPALRRAGLPAPAQLPKVRMRAPPDWSGGQV
ncbi:MAG TPA: hypothetical protein VGG45_11390 [Terracidiphilus sp.]|jgi:hypothetical protein